VANYSWPSKKFNLFVGTLLHTGALVNLLHVIRIRSMWRPKMAAPPIERVLNPVPGLSGSSHACLHAAVFSRLLLGVYCAFCALLPMVENRNVWSFAVVTSCFDSPWQRHRSNTSFLPFTAANSGGGSNNHAQRCLKAEAYEGEDYPNAEGEC
jgi:hypothetical protein